MKCIVYTGPDGSLKVVHPTPQFMSEWDDENHALDHLLYFDVPKDASNVHVMLVIDLPKDHTFRDAWKLDGNRVSIDMPKSREIHRGRLREARASKLAALDVEYQRADETGDANRKRDVAARKQALRDVTADPRIEAAKTPEELKAVWPEILS